MKAKLAIALSVILGACTSGPSCDDAAVLEIADNKFIVETSIITVSKDETTGNLVCRAQTEGALFHNRVDYTVMKTNAGELVVETIFTFDPKSE